MKKKLINLIFALLLIAGIAAQSSLLVGRALAENEDRAVAAAVYYEDIELLSRESGIGTEHWLNSFSQSGVRYIIFESQENFDGFDSAEFGMEAAILGSLTGERAFTVPIQGEALPEFDLGDLAIVKSEDRSEALLPADFDMESYEGPMVKALYSYPDYVNRYSDSFGAQEIENVYFRAVTDRGVRLILLRPMTYSDYSIVLEPSAYAEMLGGLSQRLSQRGYSFGEGYSLLSCRVMSAFVLLLCSIIPVLLWTYIISRFKPLRPYALLIAILGILGCAGAIKLFPDMAQKLIALASVLGFSLSWIYALYEHFILGKGRRFPAVWAYLLTAAASLIWGLLGGLSVAAIQTDLSYMMGESIFSGVKLSMNLPVFVCAAVFLVPLVKRLLRKDFTKKDILALIPAAIILLIAMAVLVYRSGRTDNSLGQLETSLRNTLEYAFYARPRTKEIFVAVPFMSLLFVLGRRRDGIMQLIGALCCSLETVSLVNTFCHGVVPLRVSLIRGFSGALVGAVFGLIVLGIFALIDKKIIYKKPAAKE